MSRPLVAFNWFGGKASMLGKLLPLLSAPHKTYVEPFGGSAVVLLNKEPSPVEVYNDAHGQVVNFFRVLREKGEELIQSIELTPYSREEFAEGCRAEADCPIERARQFFVVARQVMMGLATTASPGRWCAAGKQSRRGMALVVSRWLSSIDRLPEVVTRLRTVLVENKDYLDLVRAYDGPDTLFYFDPPYPMQTRTGGRGYRHEFDRHEELLDAALALRGKAAISSYPNPLYDETLAGWHRHEFPAGSRSARFHDGADLARVEVVWTNYEPARED